MTAMIGTFRLGGALLASWALAAGPAAAGWSVLEEGTMRGARLCADAAEAPACLIFACAAPGAALDLSYAEPAALPGFGRLDLTAAIDGAAPSALPVRLDPASPHRSGAIALDAGDRAGLRADLTAGQDLTLSHPEGRWSVDLTGTEAAFAALDTACAPAAPRPREPTPLAGLSGQLPVVLDREAWPDAPGTVKALTTGAHGWRMTRHITRFGTRPSLPVAKAYAAAPGRYLLIAELCGEDDYFGPDGCGLYVSSKTAGRWTVVTVRPTGTALTLDLDRLSDAGWPEIVAGDGQRWVWQDDAYRPGL